MYLCPIALNLMMNANSLIARETRAYLRQTIDSIVFINIVFSGSNQKWSLIFGSVSVKIVLSFLVTPLVYLIVYAVNYYLDAKTLAFKIESDLVSA